MQKRGVCRVEVICNRHLLDFIPMKYKRYCCLLQFLFNVAYFTGRHYASYSLGTYSLMTSKVRKYASSSLLDSQSFHAEQDLVDLKLGLTERFFGPGFLTKVKNLNHIYSILQTYFLQVNQRYKTNRYIRALVVNCNLALIQPISLSRKLRYCPPELYVRRDILKYDRNFIFQFSVLANFLAM
jgi:hypothetical protein